MMNERNVDIAVIGGGPAGLAAALAAKEAGIDDILVIEREARLGGILNQCIHHGFGIEVFGESLTGPEYMGNYVAEVEKQGIECWTDSMVLDLTPGRMLTVCRRDSISTVHAKAIILCMGCRERTRGAIGLPGTRPSGVYTAGVAQNFINLKDLMVGKNVVILGSGDIGLIMARRLMLEGARVLAVVEILPYSSGLPRNIQQCLRDFDIPLYLSHTVVDIEGKQRLNSVTIAKVDEKLKPVPGTERKIECDTLLLSVGLIPENELSRMAGVELDSVTGGAVVDEERETSIEGIFACGNALHVHDIVDFVSREAEIAGRAAARYCMEGRNGAKRIQVVAGEGVRYVLPHYVSGEQNVTLFMRVKTPGRNRSITIAKADEGRLIKKVPKPGRLVPSEMVRLDLKKSELGTDSNELIVSVVGEEEEQ